MVGGPLPAWSADSRRPRRERLPGTCGPLVQPFTASVGQRCPATYKVSPAACEASSPRTWWGRTKDIPSAPCLSRPLHSNHHGIAKPHAPASGRLQRPWGERLLGPNTARLLCGRAGRPGPCLESSPTSCHPSCRGPAQASLPPRNVLSRHPPRSAPGPLAELSSPQGLSPPCSPQNPGSCRPQSGLLRGARPQRIRNTAAPRQARLARRGPGNLHLEQIPRTVPESPGHRAIREPSRHPETLLSGVVAPAWWGTPCLLTATPRWPPRGIN